MGAFCKPSWKRPFMHVGYLQATELLEHGGDQVGGLAFADQHTHIACLTQRDTPGAALDAKARHRGPLQPIPGQTRDHRGGSTICVHRNNAIVRPVVSLVTVASHTCVWRPR
jgi:hypothetical protein